MMIPNLLPMDHCYSLADDANEVEPEPRRAMMMNWPAAAVVGTVAEADRSPTEEVLEPGRLCMGPNGCLLLKYQQKKKRQHFNHLGCYDATSSGLDKSVTKKF